jgi:glycine C-acetyltransferase
LDNLKQQGLYRAARPKQTRIPHDVRSQVRRQSFIQQHLGLTTHPKLVAAALKAVEQFGVGSGAVRTISGTWRCTWIERRLAKFKRQSSSSSRVAAANAGTVPWC